MECGIVHAVAMGKPNSLDEAMDDERVNDVDDDDDDHEDDDDEIFAYLSLMVVRSLCDVPWPCMDFIVFDRIFGDAAKNQVACNLENTVFDAKRLICRKFADSIVQADIKC